MSTPPVTPDRLQELRGDRDAADRAYNEALTAVDRAIVAPVAPVPAREVDAGLIPALDRSARVTSAVSLPPPRGLRTRLAHFIWRLVAPAFERQEQFNGQLVDHLNRQVSAAREHAAAVAEVSATLHHYTAALASLQAELIRYFQKITWYVDSKDRYEAADLAVVYGGAINGLALEILRRAEAAGVRDARLGGQVSAVGAAYDDIRGTLALVQQATATLKRELERSLASAPSATVAPSAPSALVLDSYKYVGFEDRFRGSQEAIRERLRSYIPLFTGRTDVLDVGCGRGELLDLFRAAGIGARGLDLNHEMVEACRARGLEAIEGDLLRYLESLPDASLGGLIAIQVVEHLEPGYLMRALEVAYHKLRPGSPIVLETINPACWFAYFSSYVRDLTHVRPIHPDTLQYLLTASGFARSRVEFRAPYPEHEKLQVAAWAGEDEPRYDYIATFNTNMERLNSLLFTYLDYAAIGERA